MTARLLPRSGGFSERPIRDPSGIGPGRIGTAGILCRPERAESFVIVTIDSTKEPQLSITTAPDCPVKDLAPVSRGATASSRATRNDGGRRQRGLHSQK